MIHVSNNEIAQLIINKSDNNNKNLNSLTQMKLLIYGIIEINENERKRSNKMHLKISLIITSLY